MNPSCHYCGARVNGNNSGMCDDCDVRMNGRVTGRRSTAKDDAPFYVWRRNDGYVGCTRYKPSDYKGTSGGEGSSFEHLAVFTEWAPAYEMLKELGAR